MLTFIRERFTDKSVDLFKPIKALKFKTFKPTVTTNENQLATLKSNDRSIFARLLVISRQREIDMITALKYSLASISLPLTSMDGSLAKTNKAKLLAILEDNFGKEATNGADSDVGEESVASALMVDAMALVRSLSIRSLPATFGELARLVLHRLVSLGKFHNSVRVDFVGDRYFTTIIK